MMSGRSLLGESLTPAVGPGQGGNCWHLGGGSLNLEPCPAQDERGPGGGPSRRMRLVLKRPKKAKNYDCRMVGAAGNCE